MIIEERIKDIVKQAIEDTKGENMTMENVCNHVDWDYVDGLMDNLIREEIEKSGALEQVFKGNFIKVILRKDEEDNTLYTIKLEDNQELTITSYEMIGLQKILQELKVEC